MDSPSSFRHFYQTAEIDPEKWEIISKTKVQIGKETIFGSIKFSHSLAVKAYDLVQRLSPLGRAMGMSEFCVAVPGFSKLSSSHCSDEAFSEYVKRRDPLKLGFADPLLLQLVRQLSAVDLV
ncbi:uncharacterized protein LOC130791945 isoform X2 [Actinidia eriantha]|uniref:uncharacterized protein LOC130791945 isoform X2 n=1 Tax=Actinidia eriantha TaxID=165200 RepID=UPI002587F3A2|nr:uncharacterized protein LOC130791945 isoform X2 [Actinidia eriantha]XP_057509281.1 uncharacterized protein LOC130791945 isoform X2 [Actinidia eriantha]XP_057509282.1 uncharacterized protein LOC130791945 isoform X2 [Actinidia eriantha]